MHHAGVQCGHVARATNPFDKGSRFYAKVYFVPQSSYCRPKGTDLATSYHFAFNVSFLELFSCKNLEEFIPVTGVDIEMNGTMVRICFLKSYVRYVLF